MSDIQHYYTLDSYHYFSIHKCFSGKQQSAFYSCSFLKFYFLLSHKGNEYNEKGEQIDTKSGQWFGATVSSAGIDGPLVVSKFNRSQI